MKLTDFYKLCYGVPITVFSYMDYRIIKHGFSNNSESLIICNDKIVLDLDSESGLSLLKECMGAVYLTQGISNKIEIQKSFEDFKRARLKQLQQLEELKDLPIELLELINDYQTFTPNFSRWN